MGLPTIDEIIDVIDSDVMIFDVIKSDSMIEKASYAREALLNPELYDVRFGRYQGERYTFAVYNPEVNQWWDITGHFHAIAPDDTIIKYKRKKELYEEKQDLIINTFLRARVALGLSDDIDDFRDFVDEYYEARRRIPRVCQLCGRDDKERKGFAKYEFHHIDQSLRHKMVDAESAMKAIDPLENPNEFYSATYEFLKRSMNYYTKDLSKTILLCKNCHAGVHSGKIKFEESCNGTR